MAALCAGLLALAISSSILGDTITVELGPSGVNKFVPDVVNINVGDTVMWFWQSNGHSVVEGDTFNAPDPLFESLIHNTPFIFSYTFTTPSTVKVAGATPTPSPSPTASPSPTPTPQLSRLIFPPVSELGRVTRR